MIGVIRGYGTNFNKIAAVVTEGYANIKVKGRLCSRVGLLFNRVKLICWLHTLKGIFSCHPAYLLWKISINCTYLNIMMIMRLATGKASCI